MRSNSSWPPRWRRSSTRSTASSTSTACRARTRPSSRCGSTSGRTASGASSSSSRRSSENQDVDSARGHRLGGQAGRDRRRADRHADAHGRRRRRLSHCGGSARRSCSVCPPLPGVRGPTLSAASSGRCASTSIPSGCRRTPEPAGSAAGPPGGECHAPGRRLHPQRRGRPGRGRAGRCDRADDSGHWSSACSRIGPVFLKDVATVQDGPAEVSATFAMAGARPRLRSAPGGSRARWSDEHHEAIRGNRYCDGVGESRARRDHRDRQEERDQCGHRRRVDPRSRRKSCARRDPDDVELVDHAQLRPDRR